MTEKKKKSIKNPAPDKAGKEKQSKGVDTTEQDDFDFGGFPKDVSLKRNIGCGGGSLRVENSFYPIIYVC